MVATSGAELLPRNAVRVLREQIIPYTYLLTPNIPEARLLLEDAGLGFTEPKDIQSMVELAKAVRALGAKWVLLKGGHLPLTKDDEVASEPASDSIIVNIIQGADNETFYVRTPYLQSKNTHGTGCSLACTSNSAIARSVC